MKCQDVCKNLSAYLDGELAKGEASNIAAHLMACRHCRQEWEQLNAASTLLRELPEIEPPPEFMLGLSERLATKTPVVAHEEKVSLLNRVQRMVKKPWYKVVAAAAMFGMAIGITQLWDNGNGNIINDPQIVKTVISDSQPKGGNNHSTPAVVADKGEQQQQKTNSETTSKPSNGSTTETPSNKGTSGAETPAESRNPAAHTEGVNKPAVTANSLVANVYTLSIQINVVDSDVATAAQKVRDISVKYRGKLQESGSDFELKFPRQGTDISLLLSEFNTVGEVSTVPMKDVTGEYKAQINELEQKKADLIKQQESSSDENRDKLQQQINQVQTEINKKLAEVKELSNYIIINVKLVE